MKKYITIAALLVAGAACANATEYTKTLLSMDFTTLTGNSDANMPTGWTTGQWNGDNKPHYNFGTNGAVVAQPWKQNYIETALALNSHDETKISFTLYNSVENTGNMFYLSSDTYSIVIGNSYNSNSDIYVGTLAGSIGAGFVSFQANTGTNPTVLGNSSGLNVGTSLTYELELANGALSVGVTGANGATWSQTFSNITGVGFTKLGFISDGGVDTVGVKNIMVSTIPEPSSFGLLAGLGALALVGTRRRRK